METRILNISFNISLAIPNDVIIIRNNGLYYFLKEGKLFRIEPQVFQTIEDDDYKPGLQVEEDFPSKVIRYSEYISGKGIDIAELKMTFDGDIKIMKKRKIDHEIDEN